MRLFIQDGKLTLLAELFLGAVVALGLIGIPLLNLPLWLAIPIGLGAVLAACILMFEGRATAIGLKPFTNDPLGWRKAKQTYAQDQEQQSGSNDADLK